ncbi:MAG: polysaccharide biosynthesis tyrosine autokinase, partial [Pseudomonadota bacterium]
MPGTFLEEEIHLRDYLRVILKRRWLVLTVFLIIVITVTIESFRMTPVFRATAQVLIEKENPNVMNIEEVLKVNAADQDYYQTQYEILKSKSLALKVIKALSLKESPEFTSPKNGFSLRAILSSLFGWIKKVTSSAGEPNAQSSNPDKEYNQLIAAYLQKLKVEPIRNSRLVNVSFEGKESRIITQIANTHAQLYIRSNLERRFSASEDAVAWLNERMEEVKKKLQETEEALQEYREKEELVSIDFEERQGIILQSLNDLNTALTQAKTECFEKESLYSELKNFSSSPEKIEGLPAVVANPLIQELKARHIELTGKYDKLSQKYGAEHPIMVRLSSEINTVKNKTSQEIRKIAQSIEIEYRIAAAKETSILEAMEEKKKEALELNQKQIQYNVLKREVETNRSLYESLLKRVKETSISEGLEATNIMVADPARVPDHPVKPRKAMNILLSIIVGLTLGVGLAFFFEYLDNTIKSPEEVTRYLKIPFLGVVGRFKKDSDTSGKAELIAHFQPKSNFSEAFRTIRTNLLFSSPDNEKRVLLITSVLPLEGKTFLAANLAITFAQIGKKVLLIDADLRKPRIHTIFNLERSSGLSELLVGKESTIHSVDIPELKVITAGTIPPNPAELLGSKKMKDLIEKAKDKFDAIVIDSPPLLSVTDAVEIATLSDGVIVIVRAESTPRPAIQRGIQHLTDVDAKVIGCVLNDVDFEKESYYYSYYHYYQYYYKYYGDEEKGSL